MDFERLGNYPPIPLEQIDLDKTLTFANQMLGQDRYIQHHENILGNLADYGLDSDSLSMGVALHDAVDHRLYSAGQAEKQAAQADVGQFYDHQVGNERNFVYGLGYAISAKRWEDKVAESWRESAHSRLIQLGNEEQLTLEELDIINLSIDSSNELGDIDPVEVRKTLKKAELLDLDVPSINMALEDYDVEGLIIKGVELIDNLKNPNQAKPASEWRDCIEVLNCYAPALELCGFDDLASKLRGLALEFFHEPKSETADRAKQQHELSEKYFDDLAEFMDQKISQLSEGQRNIGRLVTRVKSLGSLMEKLSNPKYASKGCLAPDGIGFKLIVPDEYEGRIDELRANLEATLAVTDDKPGFNITPGHPAGEPAFEHRKKEDNGYEARHLAFICRGMDGSGENLSFEIQLVTESQDRLNKYSEASHILYKLKPQSPADNSTLEHLEQLKFRADFIVDSPNSPGLHPNTWSELLRVLPDLKTPIHEVYSVFTLDDAQVLGPKELQQIGLGLEQDADEKVFIPTAMLTKDQFLGNLALLESSLSGNESINQAIEFLEQKRSQLPIRRDGSSTIESHLYPVALHDALLSTLSAEHEEHARHPQFLARKVVRALLHDIEEDTGSTTAEIAELFGDGVADFVSGISKEPKDDRLTKLQRRDRYRSHLKKHTVVLATKCADRSQNHTSDLVRKTKGGIQEAENLEIEDYFEETETDLLDLFVDNIPPAYIRSLEMVGNINQNFKRIYDKSTE